MEQYIYDESNGLWYERNGDYYIPCLKLPRNKYRYLGRTLSHLHPRTQETATH